MKVASIEITFPRYQAMMSIREPHYKNGAIDYEEVARVPVFVWPMPTQDGYFIVEHQDGHCQKVQPYELTLLGSKELFDKYDWSEDA